MTDFTGSPALIFAMAPSTLLAHSALSCRTVVRAGNFG